MVGDIYAKGGDSKAMIRYIVCSARAETLEGVGMVSSCGLAF